MTRTCLSTAKDHLECMEWLAQGVYTRYTLQLQMLKYKWSTTNDQIQGLLNRQKYDRGETNSKLVLIKTWFWSKIVDHKISEFQSKHRTKYEKVKVSAIADASMHLSLDSPLKYYPSHCIVRGSQDQYAGRCCAGKCVDIRDWIRWAFDVWNNIMI